MSGGSNGLLLTLIPSGEIAVVSRSDLFVDCYRFLDRLVGSAIAGGRASVDDEPVMATQADAFVASLTVLTHFAVGAIEGHRCSPEVLNSIVQAVIVYVIDHVGDRIATDMKPYQTMCFQDGITPYSDVQVGHVISARPGISGYLSCVSGIPAQMVFSSSEHLSRLRQPDEIAGLCVVAQQLVQQFTRG